MIVISIARKRVRGSSRGKVYIYKKRQWTLFYRYWNDPYTVHTKVIPLYMVIYYKFRLFMKSIGLYNLNEED